MSLKSEIFTVSLKIAGKDIKLVININQSFDQVFQKLRSISPHCNHKKTEILQKLINTLQQQLKKQSLSQNLAQSIYLFLSRNREAQKKQILSNNQAFSSNEQKSNLVNISQCEEIKANIKDQNKGSNYQQTTIIKKISSKQNHSSRSGKKFSMPSCLKRQANSSKRANSSMSSSQKPNRCNPDLIKACQIIMKKAQDNEMKQMTKQFLKEKGVLKQERNKFNHQKKIQTNEANNALAEPQIEQNVATTQKDIEHIQYPQYPQAIIVNSPKPPEFSKSNEATTRKQYSRYNKFKYLQSSFANESLNKQYNNYTLLNISQIRHKRYTYL